MLHCCVRFKRPDLSLLARVESIPVEIHIIISPHCIEIIILTTSFPLLASTQQQIARDGGVHLLLASMWRHFDKVALMEVVSNCLWGLSVGQGSAGLTSITCFATYFPTDMHRTHSYPVFLTSAVSPR